MQPIDIKSLDLTGLEAELVKAALESGAARAAVISPQGIKVMQELRDLCAANTCGNYGKNWVCPPGCGELEPFKEELKHYSRALVLQSIAQLEDSFDFEGMTEAANSHDAMFRAMWALMLKSGMTDILAMSNGGCSLCESCAYPEPCVHPDQLKKPLEGLGVHVAALCKLADIDYINGANTVSYVAMILFN